MNRSSGYTLVEVLIAVTVFAVLAATVYTALNSLSDASWVQRERAAELAQLQLAVARLDADLRQLASRPIREETGGLEPALAGQRDRLAGTRAGWANPQGHKRSELQRFAWTLGGSALLRQSWPVTDRTSASPMQSEIVMEGVAILEFRYHGPEGRWFDQWPIDEQSGALPLAVGYVLEAGRFGRIERIVVLP